MPACDKEALTVHYPVCPFCLSSLQITEQQLNILPRYPTVYYHLFLRSHLLLSLFIIKLTTYPSKPHCKAPYTG